MAGLAKEFETLGCWESAQRKKNIVIYGMDFRRKSFIVFTDDMGKTRRCKSFFVAACYSEDDCFYWGKELETSLPWQHMQTNTNPARLHCCML